MNDRNKLHSVVTASRICGWVGWCREDHWWYGPRPSDCNVEFGVVGVRRDEGAPHLNTSRFFDADVDRLSRSAGRILRRCIPIHNGNSLRWKIIGASRDIAVRARNWWPRRRPPGAGLAPPPPAFVPPPFEPPLPQLTGPKCTWHPLVPLFQSKPRGTNFGCIPRRRRELPTRPRIGVSGRL